MKINLEKEIKNGFDKILNETELVIGMTLQEAVEKQIPQKVYCAYRFCPVCDGFVETGTKYCSNCGQALKWLECKTGSDG